MFAPYFQTMLLYHEVASLFTNFPVILSTLLAAKNQQKLREAEKHFGLFSKRAVKTSNNMSLAMLGTAHSRPRP
jgi:hypothetical protein